MLTRREAFGRMLGLVLTVALGPVLGESFDLGESSLESDVLTRDEFDRVLDEVFSVPPDPKVIYVTPRFLELARGRGWVD